MKNTLRNLIVAGIISSSLIGCNSKVECPCQENLSVDINGDGRPDYVESHGINKKYFINVGNNEYQEVKLIINDGIPFFRAEKGYFDSWGIYLGDDGNIKDLKTKKF